MKNYQKILHIEENEKIASVIDRLMNTEEENILVVIPNEARVGEDYLNFKLLKREAGLLGKSLTVSTADHSIWRMLKKAGLSLDENISDLTVKTRHAHQKKSRVLSDIVAPNARKKIVLQSREEDRLVKKEEEAQEGIEKKIIEEAASADSVSSPQVRTSSELQPNSSRQAVEEKTIQEKEVKKEEAWFERTEKERLEEVEQKIEDWAKKEYEEVIEEKEKEEVSNEEEEFKFALRSRKPFRQAQDKPIRKRGFKSLLSIVQRILNSFSNKAFGYFLTASVIVAALVMYFVLPRASVNIILKRESISINVPVSADSNIATADYEKAIIPGQIIQVEKEESKEFPSTGQKTISQKASGIITVYNVFSSSPQTLVATTRFKTTNGKIFRTPTKVVVPGAKIEGGKIMPSSIDIKVVADRAGPDYNVGSVSFTIPGFKGSSKYSGFYARSKSPIKGGADGIVKAVTKEDIEQAKASLLRGLLEKTKADVYSKIPENLKFLEKAEEQKIIGVSSSAKPDDAVDIFTVTVKGSAAVFLFSENDINVLIDSALKNAIGSDQSLIDESRVIEFQNSQFDFENGTLNFNLAINGEAAANLNADYFKEKLAAKNGKEVKEILNNDTAVERAEVVLWPIWVRKVPSSFDKIEVLVK